MFEKFIVYKLDAKKETNLVRTSVVQIGQTVQNSSKVSGNSAKWKQLVDSAEADRQALLDGQALVIGSFHVYVATYTDVKNSLQQSSKESGQEDAPKKKK
jgi:hypothetical protein